MAKKFETESVPHQIEGGPCTPLAAKYSLPVRHVLVDLAIFYHDTP